MVNFATSMFAHPNTACNEQNLNSVVVKPAKGENLPLPEARWGITYRIEGYAYNGGGHEVQRWRFPSMILRRGSTAFVDFLTPPSATATNSGPGYIGMLMLKLLTC